MSDAAQQYSGSAPEGGVSVGVSAAEKTLSTRYLTPENAAFAATQGGFASLRVGDECHDRVNFYLAFPFTAPESYISVRDCTLDAKEIGMIEELAAWDGETGELIKRQIALRYFLPVASRLLSLKREQGFAYFHALTDRGECKFTVQLSAGAVKRITETRMVVLDIDGNRFEIGEGTAMSGKTRRQLELIA